MLVRRFIGKRLADYYAQPSNRVVGGTPSALEGNRLSSLWGEWHWKRLYKRLYDEQEGQWLTPVELFRPHYSNILANFITAEANKHLNRDDKSIPNDDTSEVHVVELGGGRATNANHLLSHLQQVNPQLYDRLSYTIVDASPSLHELQQQILCKSEHSEKINFVLKDLIDVAENKVALLPKSETPTIVVALELLDNLPHDKVRRCKRSRKLEQAELRRCVQDSFDSPFDDTAHLEEIFVPMTDPLLNRILEVVPLYGGRGGRPYWVPSVACGVLDHIQQSRTNSSVLMADFDYLPTPDNLAHPLPPRRSFWADGEPLITDMDKLDYECYLESPPHCDILFPTNFLHLGKFAEQTSENDAQIHVYKQSTFLEAYGPEEVKATKSWMSGFSPLLHDFGNVSVLSVTKNTKHAISQ